MKTLLLILLVLCATGCLAPAANDFCQTSNDYLDAYRDRCIHDDRRFAEHGSCKYTYASVGVDEDTFTRECVPLLTSGKCYSYLPEVCHVKFRELF